MANSTVLKHITWPHELMYATGGQPTVYEHLTLPLFISWYLAILEMVKPAQKEAMLKPFHELVADAEIYAARLQQLENGWLTGEFRRGLIWNLIHWSSSFKAPPMAAPHQKSEKEASSNPMLAKLGTKACAAYNSGKCVSQADHLKELHICTYCLSVAHTQCTHQEHFCRLKLYDESARKYMFGV